MAEHPDEGTIHAWLDGALDAASAASLEAHVATCDACSAAVAEARGLIAGASRVVRMLDETPAPLVVPVKEGSSLWRMLRVTPARASIAAALVVAVGIVLTRDRAAVDSQLVTPVSTTMAPVAPSVDPRARPAPLNDSVLKSAIAERLKKDAPQRVVGRASGAAIPMAPPSVAGAVAEMNAAPAREVAAARDSVRLADVTAGARADKSSAKLAFAPAPGAGCYRLETADGSSATWQGVVLPLDVSLTSTASSFTAPPASAGADAVGESRFAIVPINSGEPIGQWSRRAGDTLSIALRGGSPTVVGVLGSNAAVAAGAMRSRAAAAPAVAPVEKRVAAPVVARKMSCPR